MGSFLSSFYFIFFNIPVYKNRPPFGQQVKCQGLTFCSYIPTRPIPNSAAETF